MKIEPEMLEIWKDIEDYEGLYQVSNLSRVKRLARYVVVKARADGSHASIRCYKEKIAAQSLITGHDCYYTVNLNDDHGANRKKRSVHRLVAKAFIPNPENHPEVDHIDRDKLNNNLSNLRWVSKQQQQWNTGAEKTYRGQETTSKYKGVFYRPTAKNRHKAGSRAEANGDGWYVVRRTKPWEAVIMTNGKTKYLGCYLTEKEAAESYNQKAKELRGDFAVLNEYEN